MGAKLIGTATGYVSKPTRLGPEVLVCKRGTLCIKKSIGGAFFGCLAAATVILFKSKSTGKFHFNLPQPCQIY